MWVTLYLNDLYCTFLVTFQGKSIFSIEIEPHHRSYIFLSKNTSNFTKISNQFSEISKLSHLQAADQSFFLESKHHWPTFSQFIVLPSYIARQVSSKIKINFMLLPKISWIIHNDKVLLFVWVKRTKIPSSRRPELDRW